MFHKYFENSDDYYNDLNRHRNDLYKAVELNPDDAMAYNQRGIHYSAREGNFAAAIADMRKAVQLDPQLSIAWYNLGIFYDELKDFAAAITAYSRAIELEDPAVRPSILSTLLSNRGNANFKQGNVAAAILDFNKALQRDPDSDYYKQKLAMIINNNTKETIFESIKQLSDRDEAIFMLQQLHGSKTLFGQEFAPQKQQTGSLFSSSIDSRIENYCQLLITTDRLTAEKLQISASDDFRSPSISQSTPK